MILRVDKVLSKFDVLLTVRLDTIIITKFMHQCLVEMQVDSQIHNKLFIGLDTQQ